MEQLALEVKIRSLQVLLKSSVADPDSVGCGPLVGCGPFWLDPDVRDRIRIRILA
jgi:hypothetical protein